MAFISWGIIFCVIILVTHISSNEMNRLSKKMDEALRTIPEETDSQPKGMFIDSETYIKTGKRQALVGSICVVWLLSLYNVQPSYDYFVNVFLYVINGLIIWALLGYSVEGLVMWNSSKNDSSEEEYLSQG